jgi:glutaminase
MNYIPKLLKVAKSSISVLLITVNHNHFEADEMENTQMIITQFSFLVHLCLFAGASHIFYSITVQYYF